MALTSLIHGCEATRCNQRHRGEWLCFRSKVFLRGQNIPAPLIGWHGDKLHSPRCSESGVLSFEIQQLLTVCVATQSLAKQLCPVLNEDRKVEVIVVTTLVTVLALAAVILRILSRKLGGVKFWWDDYLIFFAMVRDMETKHLQDCLCSHDLSLSPWVNPQTSTCVSR